jgi:hypothetical protein
MTSFQRRLIVAFFRVAHATVPMAADTALNAFQPAKLGQDAHGQARRLLLEHVGLNTKMRGDDDR